jgi:hypothetical protein
MSRPVIALAAFSLAAAFNSECEDSQHGSHRKNQQEVSHNHDRQRAALKQSLGCNQAQQHRSRCDPGQPSTARLANAPRQAPPAWRARTWISIASWPA